MRAFIWNFDSLERTCQSSYYSHDLYDCLWICGKPEYKKNDYFILNDFYELLLCGTNLIFFLLFDEFRIRAYWNDFLDFFWMAWEFNPIHYWFRYFLVIDINHRFIDSFLRTFFFSLHLVDKSFLWIVFSDFVLNL